MQFGGFCQWFPLPEGSGEKANAYDVTTPSLEFTLGYYQNIRGTDPEKGVGTIPKYLYDPNM